LLRLGVDSGKRAIEIDKFCQVIRDTLHKPWESPEEQQRRKAAEAEAKWLEEEQPRKAAEIEAKQ
jgi:hypothetical protein